VHERSVTSRADDLTRLPRKSNFCFDVLSYCAEIWRPRFYDCLPTAMLLFSYRTILAGCCEYTRASGLVGAEDSFHVS
jgi:hypothetical protein